MSTDAAKKETPEYLWKGDQQAFPLDGHNRQQKGLTTRLYIATEVLSGLVSRGKGSADGDLDFYTKTALKYADSLIREDAK